MAASMSAKRILIQLRKSSTFMQPNRFHLSQSCRLCQGGASEDISTETKGFIHAQEQLRKLEKNTHSQLSNDNNSTTTSSDKKSEKQKTFAELFYESPYTQVGKFSGEQVFGKIMQEAKGYLYIDYGGKFYCVCKKPEQSDSNRFKVGCQVLVKLYDLEMTSRFMGFDKDMSLLEADGRLVGSVNADGQLETLVGRSKDQPTHSEQFLTDVLAN